MERLRELQSIGALVVPGHDPNFFSFSEQRIFKLSVTNRMNHSQPRYQHMKQKNDKSTTNQSNFKSVANENLHEIPEVELKQKDVIEKKFESNM